MKRVCIHCGKEFFGTKKALYCSVSCRVMAYERRRNFREKLPPHYEALFMPTRFQLERAVERALRDNTDLPIIIIGEVPDAFTDKAIQPIGVDYHVIYPNHVYHGG